MREKYKGRHVSPVPSGHGFENRIFHVRRCVHRAKQGVRLMDTIANDLFLQIGVMARVGTRRECVNVNDWWRSVAQNCGL